MIDFTCLHCGHQTRVADECTGAMRLCPECGKSTEIPKWPATRICVQSRKPLTIWVIVVVLLLLCVGLLPLLPFFSSAREAAVRMQCSNNLKHIGLALHNYHTAEGCFPPAYLADEDGTPMHSWRVLILPYLGYSKLYDQYDFSQPWDSPTNRSVTSQTVTAFRCANAPSASDTLPGETHYAMIASPGTISDGTSSSTLDDITDGTSCTIMVVETVGSGIPWAEPRDLAFEDLQYGINGKPGKSPGSVTHSGGAHILMADGAVRFVKDSLSVATLKALATKASGDEIVLEF